MSRWRVSRFHGLTALTLLAGAVLTPGWPWAIAGSAYAAVVALGVAFPRLQLFGPSLCRVATERKVVALTFDDGPDPEVTPPLLDLLKQEGIPAAFFCIGRKMAQHPEIVRRIAAEGHLLANHTYQHSHLTNFFSVRRLSEDLRRAQDECRRHTGQPPLYFRPPMGLTNPRVFAAAGRCGLRTVGWTARGLDTRARGPEPVVRRLARGIRPGAIVLLHDKRPAGKVPVLLPAVRALIAELRRRDYQIWRLDRMISLGGS